jgi:hypothetical protein
MHNKLLYANDIKDVPLDVIQRLTSKAMAIDLEMMFLTNKMPGARKREYVTMRQVSMALAKEYTKLSLVSIGSRHGGRDHATTLHAIKTVHNLIDAKDHEMLKSYKNALDLIKDWNAKRTGEAFKMTLKQLKRLKKNLEFELADTIRQLNTMLNKPDINKFNHLKILIRNRVPLEIRQQILEGYGATYKMF